MPLAPTDHAFANGPVFQRPSSPDDALRMVHGDQDAAEMLLAVFEQFDEKAVLADGVRLALNARLILILANQIGDTELLRQAIALAAMPDRTPRV